MQSSQMLASAASGWLGAFSSFVSELGGFTQLGGICAVAGVIVVLLSFKRLASRLAVWGMAAASLVMAGWGIMRLMSGSGTSSLGISLISIGFVFNMLQAELTWSISAGGFSPATKAEKKVVGMKALGLYLASLVGMLLVTVVTVSGQFFLPPLGFVLGTAPAQTLIGMCQSLVAAGVGLVSTAVMASSGTRGRSHQGGVFPDRPFQEVKRLRFWAVLTACVVGAGAVFFAALAWTYRAAALPFSLLVTTGGPACVSTLVGGGGGAIVNWVIRRGGLPGEEERREAGEFFKSVLVSMSLTLLSAGLGFMGESLLALASPFRRLPATSRESAITFWQTVITSSVDTVRYALYAAVRPRRMELATMLAAGFLDPKQLVNHLGVPENQQLFSELLGLLDRKSLRFLLANLSIHSSEVARAISNGIKANRVVERRILKEMEDTILLSLLLPRTGDPLNVEALDIIPPARLYKLVVRGALGEAHLKFALEGGASPETVGRFLVALVECGASRLDFVKWALAQFLTSDVWNYVRASWPEVIAKLPPRLAAMYAAQVPIGDGWTQYLRSTKVAAAVQPKSASAATDDTAASPVQDTEPAAAYPPQPAAGPAMPGSPERRKPGGRLGGPRNSAVSGTEKMEPGGSAPSSGGQQPGGSAPSSGGQQPRSGKSRKRRRRGRRADKRD